MVDNNKLIKLMNIIKESNNIVFFGGAGVSTASNIPDFRGANGLYKYALEEIISHSFFMNHTKEFFDFYFSKMVYLNALPNECHRFLTLLEQDNKLSSIVTQNIDSLHQHAGSKKVFELHGSIERNYCMKCGKFYSIYDDVFKSINYKGIPLCDCGGIIKPDVVLYEEPLDNKVIMGALKSISSADTMIIAGTSLKVYPAADFLRWFEGKNLIVINLGKLEIMDNVTLSIDGKVEDYLNTNNYNKYIKEK